MILVEETVNEHLHIVLEGEVEMLKKDVHGEFIVTDKFEPGSFLGLMSFWTHAPTFTSSRAITSVKCVSISREDYDLLNETNPQFSRICQDLMIKNLVERYRRMVNLNVEVQTLTSRLVHQEKLATLGQLLAGIAHEMNNPVGALLSNVDTLYETIPQLFQKGASSDAMECERKLLDLGLNSPYLSTQESRTRMACLTEKFPHLKRSMIRKLALLQDEGIQLLQNEYQLTQKNAETKKSINGLLSFFEAGVYLRTIASSSKRIQNLILSLKSYGRPDHHEPEKVDIRHGLQDTLVLLNNRLKHYQVHLDLPDIPEIECYPGEINQVWTNILTNACDAMPPGETIYLACGYDDKEKIWVTITDSGKGIPKELLHKIFEANFTTKSRGASFGLGLGLAISRDIIEKHNGTLVASNSSGGGACFRITLPIKMCN